MRFSLRLKLTLVSLLLLLIPLIGFRFSDIIKKDLVESRKKTLLFAARAVSSALGGRTGLFDREIFHSLDPAKDLYIYKLTNPMRLNGKTDDWQPFLSEARTFGREHILFVEKNYNYTADSLHFKHLVGVRGKYLYALFLVTDDKIVYRNPNSLRLNRSDHLQIGIEDKNGKMHRYLVTTTKPGWINGFLMPRYRFAAIPLRMEPAIQGMWEETDGGYIIELRIPMKFIGQKLAFAIGDVDDEKERTMTCLIGTAATESADKLGWLLSESTTIEKLLKSFDRPHSRVLIVDTNQRIRASYGSLAAETSKKEKERTFLESLHAKIYAILSPLYRLFTQPFSVNIVTPRPQPTTLDLKGIKEGLEGKSSVTSYFPKEQQVEIMAAIVPLLEQNKIVGAVVVEQTTNSILALQNKVIEESLTFTVLAFVIGGFGLLFFASRLSSRIRKLGNQASRAISSNGQIITTIDPSPASDEIGDLSRTLSSMLDQLKSQIEYREKMADNLEHEIRTPLAGISASLKNMAQEMSDPSPRIRDYLDWALEDIERLETLLTAVRDATNLSEALAHDFKEDFDLSRAIEMWLNHGWKQAFPGIDFVYNSPQSPHILHGDPARIRQMLDKLIENAISFHTEETPIEINLRQEYDFLELRVINEGTPIPQEFETQIFSSMVSFRQQKGTRPHLGLGLYIVQTIVAHHQGSVRASSLQDGRTGAAFTVRLPTTVTPS